MTSTQQKHLYDQDFALWIEDYPHLTFPEVSPFPTEVETLLTARFWEQ